MMNRPDSKGFFGFPGVGSRLGQVSVCLMVVCALLVSPLALAQTQAMREQNEQAVWHSLRQAYFQNQDIEDGADVLALAAPYRAEDPAVVPIEITDKLAHDDDRHIDKLWLVIDNNPEPMSAVFEFGPGAESADLAMRVRVNSYTYMRVIAKTSDGQLYMVKRYVKASGGCSAPVGRDPEKALEHMGEMRLRTVRMDEGQGSLTQLLIRHPNITGLQMDQLTRLVYPAHFVDAITVDKGNAQVFDAHMTFSLSENPSVQFDVRSDMPGPLSVRVEDNKDNVFQQSWPMQAKQPPAAANQKSAS